MLHCIYHPIQPFKVVEDEEFDRLLETGMWFAHPTDAKNMREKHGKVHEEQGLHVKRRKRSRNYQQPPENGGDAA